MEEVIKLAIKGGWLMLGYGTLIKKPIKVEIKDDRIIFFGKPTDDGWDSGQENSKLSSLDFNKIVLDPLFWQALGKALGLGDYAPYGMDNDNPRLNSWHWWALTYFALKLDGGDESKFWKYLINPKE